MTRPLNLLANPLRLLLLALLLAVALLVAMRINQPLIHGTGSQSLPASVVVTAPDPGIQPAANSMAGTTATQSTSATTQIVATSGQSAPIPVAKAPGNNAAPTQSAPAEAGCFAGGPPAAPGIASHCPGG